MARDRLQQGAEDSHGDRRNAQGRGGHREPSAGEDDGTQSKKEFEHVPERRTRRDGTSCEGVTKL